MKVDMSPEAITARMEALNQLWELSVALQSSEVIEEQAENKDLPQKNDDRDEQK